MRRLVPTLALLALAACESLVTGGELAGAVVDEPAAEDEPDGDPGPDETPLAGNPLFAASAAVFDETIIRRYDLVLTPAALAELEATPTDEQFVPAEVRVDGQSFPLAAVRYKGAYTLHHCFDAAGTQICDKVSLKLSFNEVDPDGNYHGLRKLNLHSMIADPTKMHDAISYRLFRDAGIAAPRTAYARVALNGADLGLFAVVENVDGRFTRSRFPDGGEGNLYEDVWPVSSTPDTYLAGLKTNEDDDPSPQRMIDFAADLTAAGEAGFVEAAEEWKVFEPLMRYMAIARLIDHWDDVVAWYARGDGSAFNHNFFWYESAVDDQVWLIPWDMDHTLEPNPHRASGFPEWDDLGADCAWSAGEWLMPASCDPIIRAMATAGRPRYVALTEELLGGAFAPAAVNARIDELTALIAGEVTTDPDRQTVAEWQTAVSEMRQHLDTHRAFIAARLY